MLLTYRFLVSRNRKKTNTDDVNYSSQSLKTFLRNRGLDEVHRVVQSQFGLKQS